MELLILKSDNNYIRIKEDQFYLVGLDKASVFPMDQMEKIKDYEIRLRLRDNEFPGIRIKKLVLTEKNVDD